MDRHSGAEPIRKARACQEFDRLRPAGADRIHDNDFFCARIERSQINVFRKSSSVRVPSTAKKATVMPVSRRSRNGIS